MDRPSKWTEVLYYGPSKKTETAKFRIALKKFDRRGIKCRYLRRVFPPKLAGIYKRLAGLQSNTLLCTMSRAKNWVFTLNNPEALLDMELFPDLEYGVYQEEMGESGTHHFQGLLCFHQRKRLTALKKLPGMERSHFQVMRGTLQQAEEYCTKVETRIAHSTPHYTGNRPVTQGARMDIMVLTHEGKKGTTFKRLLDEHEDLAPVVAKHMRYTEKLVSTYAKPHPRPDVKVTLHYGPPGTGKSHCCSVSGGAAAYWFPGGRFWERYSGQTSVILDEFKGNKLLASEFNAICDKYPCQVDLKGSSEIFNGTDIHIASNYLPSTWYSEEAAPQESIYRRIHEVHWHDKYKHYFKFNTDEEGTAMDKFMAKYAEVNFVRA